MKHSQFVAGSDHSASDVFNVAGTPSAKLFESLIHGLLDADIISAIIIFFCRKNRAPQFKISVPSLFAAKVFHWSILLSFCRFYNRISYPGSILRILRPILYAVVGALGAKITSTLAQALS